MQAPPDEHLGHEVRLTLGWQGWRQDLTWAGKDGGIGAELGFLDALRSAEHGGHFNGQMWLKATGALSLVYTIVFQYVVCMRFSSLDQDEHAICQDIINAPVTGIANKHETLCHTHLVFMNTLHYMLSRTRAVGSFCAAHSGQSPKGYPCPWLTRKKSKTGAPD